jgi:hypothetical protein
VEKSLNIHTVAIDVLPAAIPVRLEDNYAPAAKEAQQHCAE